MLIQPFCSKNPTKYDDDGDDDNNNNNNICIAARMLDYILSATQDSANHHINIT